MALEPGVVDIVRTQAQLAQLWESVGGNPASSLIASAVAMAESGGHSAAVNHDSDGSTDRGYWQINSVHGAESTFDPVGNAEAAVSVSGNGSSWTPWTTYNNGAYLAFMNGAVLTVYTGPGSTLLQDWQDSYQQLQNYLSTGCLNDLADLIAAAG